MTLRNPRVLIHQALLFDSADGFLASAVPFVVDGLRRGHAVLAVISGPNADLLRGHLDGDASQVTFLDAANWFDAPGRTLAAYHRQVDELTDRHAFLRVLGEPIWADRDALETSEWGRYESVLNVALATSPAWIMCGYDSRTLSSAIVDDARRTHPELAVGGNSQPSTGYAEPAAYYAERNVELVARPAEGVELLPIFGDLALVRGFVQAHAIRLGVPPHRLDDFVLAVNEVATNAVRHGGGYGEARLWSTERRVTCEITDPGTAADSFLGFLRADPHAERGHGLWIARQVCDLLEIHSGKPGTTIRLHIRRF